MAKFEQYDELLRYIYERNKIIFIEVTQLINLKLKR